MAPLNISSKRLKCSWIFIALVLAFVVTQISTAVAESHTNYQKETVHNSAADRTSGNVRDNGWPNHQAEGEGVGASDGGFDKGSPDLSLRATRDTPAGGINNSK